MEICALTSRLWQVRMFFVIAGSPAESEVLHFFFLVIWTNNNGNIEIVSEQMHGSCSFLNFNNNKGIQVINCRCLGTK